VREHALSEERQRDIPTKSPAEAGSSKDHQGSRGSQAAFRLRRARPKKPAHAAIRLGSPAPTIGAGTAAGVEKRTELAIMARFGGRGACSKVCCKIAGKRPGRPKVSCKLTRWPSVATPTKSPFVMLPEVTVKWFSVLIGANETGVVRVNNTAPLV
jgi:hypothetical protein